MWSATAISPGGAALELRVGTRPLGSAALGNQVSPVEYLLISIASCLALSCRVVLLRRRIELMRYQVHVVGEKAPEPPSRLSRMSATINLPAWITEAVARAIAHDAEALCTVSNTILGACPIAVSAHLMPVDPAPGDAIEGA